MHLACLCAALLGAGLLLWLVFRRHVSPLPGPFYPLHRPVVPLPGPNYPLHPPVTPLAGPLYPLNRLADEGMVMSSPDFYGYDEDDVNSCASAPGWGGKDRSLRCTAGGGCGGC